MILRIGIVAIVIACVVLLWGAETSSSKEGAEIQQLKDQVRILKAAKDYSDALLSAVRNDVANCMAAMAKEKESEARK